MDTMKIEIEKAENGWIINYGIEVGKLSQRFLAYDAYEVGRKIEKIVNATIIDNEKESER